MNLNVRAVLKIIGMVLLVISFLMVPSLIVAGIYREVPALFAFFSVIFLATVLGFLLLRTGKPLIGKLKVRDGYLIVSLCWITASLLGAVPFILSGGIPNWFDAFFESCSGFSTTGSSTLSEVTSLPKSILFWRAFTQWIGGMGILLFAIALMPSLGISGQNIAIPETPGPALDKITPKASETARDLYLIYLFLTALEVILLCLGGMSLYDALVQTFSTIGTGGFSNYNNGIAHFNSIYIEIVIMIFMLLSSLNFNLYHLSLRRGISVILKDSEFRFYMVIQASTIVLIALNLIVSGGSSIGGAILDSAFQTTSILSTTGFASSDYNLWPTFSKMLLFLLMFIGACSSSTGGGLKAARVLIMLRLVAKALANKLHPNAVVTVKLNNRTVPGDTVSAIINYFFLHIAVIFASTILVSLDNFDFVTSFSTVLTCVGNIGPGFELVGPMADFSMFSPAVKTLLSFLMLAGRLELFALLILLMPRFWNSDH